MDGKDGIMMGKLQGRMDKGEHYCKSTKFWRAIIFGEFGELRVFANICRPQYIRGLYTA